MNLENDLQKLHRLKADNEFKQNLRKRILNEYSFVHDKNVSKPENLSIISNLQKNIYNFFYRFIKFNSALSLSFVILLFVSLGSYASFSILPESVKTTVSEGFKSISKPNVDFEVVSNIEGASVFVNDKYIGLTPLNVDIKEGSYSIRVEKDGYIAYNSEITLDKLKESNKLNIELPRSVSANNWVKYENKENRISFFYPDTWNLIEKKLENQNRISQIIVENGNTSIGITLKSADSPTLLNTQKQKIYIGKIIVNEKIYKRYLVFNQYNEYTLGGIWINDDRMGQANIAYNFDDVPKDQLLKSEQLNLLDQISMSFLSSQSEEYVYNPTSFKAIENIEYLAESKNSSDNSVDDIESGEVIEIPDYLDITDENENEESLGEYINKVYGYKISLPENWFVSSSRAEYPLLDRGHLIEKDGKSYKVARLKIYSDLEGSIYMFMTNNDKYDINDGGNLCNLAEVDKKVINVDDNYELVTSKNTTKYNYQLCSKSNEGSTSEIKIESIKNGNIRYTIYWDASESEVLNTLDSFKGVINGIEFNDNYIETPIDKVTYTYKDNDLQFNYKYSWNIQKQEVGCTPEEIILTPTLVISPMDEIKVVDPTITNVAIQTIKELNCRAIKVLDGDQVLLEIKLDTLGMELSQQENQILRTKDLKGIRYYEVFSVKKECEIDEFGIELCEDKEIFDYGLGKVNKNNNVINIKYNKSSESIYNLLKSFRVL